MKTRNEWKQNRKRNRFHFRDCHFYAQKCGVEETSIVDALETKRVLLRLSPDKPEPHVAADEAESISEYEAKI
jgi:hypothetical protein